ncbi:MAG TPA: VIT1/CCC1 transporter family protein [Candidatus Polarisedimenticolia bacterium]|nr:VIT1/CCC1 transporter family protein [Candidatus Polarisedimenticolia bacterium]
MPLTPHVEKHFLATDKVRDVVIGMADGLTVPFALAAGLSGITASSRLVVTAGLAEIVAGAIAMGLGGYLAARTDYEHYQAERSREFGETVNLPQEEAREVAQVFRGFGLPEEQLAPIVATISSDRTRWVEFMMRFELGLERPDPDRARWSAARIAGAYVAGGLVPLLPYMLAESVPAALAISVAVTIAALFVFGYVKGRLTGMRPLLGGVRTVLLGGLASAAAFAIARAVA